MTISHVDCYAVSTMSARETDAGSSLRSVSSPSRKCAKSINDAITLITASVCACAVYANLAFAVTNKADYQYFPPFKGYLNANKNDYLAGECVNIAESLVRGEGFANPFDGEKTGPTAWMPPLLPMIQA